jgi:glycosyltransferase involved in cell wall biosynthesis
MTPYTTNMEAFRRAAPRPPAGGAIRLLFTGMLVERKGVLPFLSVLQRWAVDHPQRRISFEIAGDGPLRAALTRFETAPNLTVTVLNAVPYDRLPALYAAADVYVMPTLADEWGVVVNEAMAAGLPVLGSGNSQAVEELVTEGETGWTFQPEVQDSVYAAIDRALLVSADGRARMGRAACDRVFQLTPDVVAARIAGAVCQTPQSF